MQKQNVQQILEELKQTYPKYEILSHLTQQRGGKFLFVIKGFDASGDIDEWSVDVVYPLFGDIRRFLEQRENALKYVRLLFVRSNQFVFYTPNIGQDNVFRKMKKTFHLDCYGSYENQHYVGECPNIDDVLEYLKTTDVWF